MIILDKTGGRVVQLYIPFEHNGKKIESITLSPLKLGHVLQWNEGYWPNMIALLVSVANVDEVVLRELRYPDADRVMESFLTLLTPEIRNDLQEGRIPVKQAAPQPTPTNGSGEPLQGPGVPLPPALEQEPGFDLSEEQ